MLSSILREEDAVVQSPGFWSQEMVHIHLCPFVNYLLFSHLRAGQVGSRDSQSANFGVVPDGDTQPLVTHNLMLACGQIIQVKSIESY